MNERSLEIHARTVIVRAVGAHGEIDACARIMTDADPWRTLRRSYEAGLRLLERSDREVYVAVSEGSVVGFVILCLVGGFVGYLQTIAVREDWRSLGLGRQLIGFAEERIFSEHPNVFICVSSFNPRARALYERLGYEAVGPIRDFVVAGHDELLLRKTRGPLYGWREDTNPAAASAP